MKREIRKQMHERRLLQPDAKRRGESKRILEHLFSLPEFKGAKNVLFYLSKKYEVRTDEMILKAISEGKAVFLPKTKGNWLEIYEISSLEKMVRGLYDVLEPDAKGFPADPKKIDCVIVPGVSFDIHGNRIGHGLGYYDRFLKGVRKDACLIGLCFEFQVSPKIPAAPHDVGVHFVITEKRTIRCSK